jgi:probable F420-dependent oxidoreductase
LVSTLSIGLPSFSPDDPGSWRPLFDRARAADAAGVDRVVVSDHVVYGEQLEAYGRPELGGVQGGVQPTGPDGHWLEPLVVLSAVSSVTTRVRLGTSIVQAALRRPAVLAKQAATLDVLSEGRLDLGVGVGWQRAEYDVAGLDFDSRGRLLDHTLIVCETLWQQGRAALDTPELKFEDIHMMPKPRQPGGIPIWVSGTLNKAVVRRLARFGTRWILWGPAAAEPVAAIAAMRSALADAGGDPAALEVSAPLRSRRGADGSVDLAATMDAVPALVDGGVTDFRGNLPLADDLVTATEQLSELVEAFRKVTA